MDSQLSKSLIELIDETLFELEELRKSRFSAAEVKIEGPGDGIAGKPSDGELDAKKAEDEDEDDKDEKEDKEDMDKAEECAKEEGDDEADDMEKKEDDEDEEEEHEDEDEDEDDKEEMKKEEHPDKKKTAESAKKIKGESKKILEMHKMDMKKSLEDSESLIKSYVEERVQPLEEKLSTILELVNKIADQPVAPKGVSTKTAPLFKSEGEFGYETLSKAQVASKLFELKKSGARVDSLDIAKAEMGQDLTNIIKKYEIS